MILLRAMLRPIARFLAQSAWLLVLALALAGCKRNPANATNQSAAPTNALSEQFLSLMNAGKNYLDQGDATNALAVYNRALAIRPSDADLRLNLANSYLLAGAAAEAIREADEVFRIEPNSAAAYFVKGSAHLRLSNWEEAVKALENVKKIDPGETATFFQLGKGRMGLNQWEEAIAAFREGIRLDPNRLHRAAHYLLGQALLRSGRETEAQQEFQQHQINIEAGGAALDTAAFERCKYTRARVPFRLDQPANQGVPVQFVDATGDVLGEAAARFTGPMGVIDSVQSGWNSLFVTEPGAGFRLLCNTNGTFTMCDAIRSAIPSGGDGKVLVGDLQNDRAADVVVLGANGTHFITFATNGMPATVAVHQDLQATDGILMDLDFTGKLDLIAVTGATRQVRIYRQFGPLQFSDITSTSGIPATLQNAESIAMEDWNRDDHMDLLVSRSEGPPLLLEKQRGGPLVPQAATNWPSGVVFCTGDWDNDLRPDLAVLNGGGIILSFNSGERKEIPLPSNADFDQLWAVDHDNDGWLDLWATGQAFGVWRNAGLGGFQEQTRAVGLSAFNGGAVTSIVFADFDRDCDSDAIVTLSNGGLRYLRNDGGNANQQVKVRLVGNRSNASGIGCKVEIETGGLRLLRTVHRLPVEIGVGKHQTLDSFLVHWFNWPQGAAEVPFTCQEPLFALELTIQEGSCPYLYAWDGKGFRFVTDILGAAPLGLPIDAGRYVQADPEEFVWIGNEASFPPRDGEHVIQITEELREVLYLDEAKLVVVDHEPDTEVHPTDKLLPKGPFPTGTLMTLHNEQPLLRAETLQGDDVTSALQTVDGRRVSPPALRVPQLRGLAEPHGLMLDFGPLDASRALVLVLNGWLRFGGGMANIAASQDPGLPFPFPVLEVEIGPETWQAVDVTVGAPAGKTKTILVELQSRLPAGARRLRLTGAYEIHWDRIALLERKPDAATRISFIHPSTADLHYRGFSALKHLPPDWPLTPDYDRASPVGLWTLIPGGWCSRYGDILELIATRDDGLALINAGDELTLKFPASSFPPKREGVVRDFFLYVDGWDKDSDFHVKDGTQVEPLPFHGMNDQQYGEEKRPSFLSDALHLKFNTRWVEGRALKPTAAR